MLTFEKYYEQIGSKPNELAMRAIQSFRSRTPEGGKILDLGAGNGRDVAYALRVCKSPEALTVDTSDFPSLLNIEDRRVSHQKIAILDYRPAPAEFDLALCFNTFFFIPPRDVGITMGRVWMALKPGGLFACNFLGPQSTWVTEEKPCVYCVTHQELAPILANGWSKLHGETMYHDKPAIGGTRVLRWEIFSFVLEKPSTP